VTSLTGFVLVYGKKYCTVPSMARGRIMRIPALIDPGSLRNSIRIEAAREPDQKNVHLAQRPGAQEKLLWGSL
jgi:hypothetical protein